MMSSINLNGLILSGGHSKRMQVDKGTIDYHGSAQKYYLYDLLRAIDIPCYISQRKDQKQDVSYEYIFDEHTNIGFLSGILSAFKRELTGWIVVGCDYPLFGKPEILELVEARDKTKLATIIEDSQTGFLIPSLGIYEPAIYPYLLDAVDRKKYSLQRILKELDFKVVRQNSNKIKSIDTPEASAQIKKMLKG